MMEIKLEGVAGRRFGRCHKLAVNNPKDAIRALCHLLPGFREFLTSSHEFGIYFQVLTNHSDNNSYEELSLGCSTFSLVPVITGGADLFKNIGLILIGVLLVAISFGAFGIAFGAAGTISAGIQTALMSLGFALIFTGIAGLFAPGVPQDGKQEGSGANDAVFSGAPSSASQGAALPLLYGEYLASGMPVVSSYVQNENGYVMMIVSEGPIVGLANNSKNKDLYFNGLQAQAAGLVTDNIQLTKGSQTNVAINIVKSAGFHLAVGSVLPQVPVGAPDTTIIRSFNQSAADELRLRIVRGPSYMLRQKSPKKGGSPSTSYKAFNSESDKGGSENDQYLRWRIQVFNATGTAIYDKEVNDEGPLKAQKLYDVGAISISGQPTPISIKVTRLDKGPIPDPESEEGGANIYSFQWAKGDVQFVSADVSWHEKLIYPHSALLACKFDAAEFTQMPSIQGLFKGLKVPVINPDLTTTLAWSDNPVHVLLDLLTNSRYGCGEKSYTTAGTGQPVVCPGISPSDIDLASFKVAADYCVQNSITFNAYINRSADALDLIRSIAATFQGSLIYYGGKVSLIIDKKLTLSDQSLFRLFTEANTIQETDEAGEVTQPCFQYEGTSKKARTSAVEVSFVDPTAFYQERKESIEDAEAIDRYGYNQQRIRALGCTSRPQARRLGRYILGSNTLNTETVSFQVGTEGAVLLPGDICVIADPLKTQIQSGGRIKSATSTTIFLDRSPVLTAGTWYLYTYSTSGIAQRSKVVSMNGSVCTVAGFTSVPTASHMWILVNEDSEQYFRRYRVQAIKESGNGIFDVLAIIYTDRKFEYMETGDLDYGPGYSTFQQLTNPAINPDKISFSIRNLDT